MTHEQMVAWLALEGWEYCAESADAHTHVIRNKRVYEIGMCKYAGELVCVAGGGTECYWNGTTGASRFDPAFAKALPQEIELIYEALNNPDTHWSER